MRALEKIEKSALKVIQTYAKYRREYFENSKTSLRNKYFFLFIRCIKSNPHIFKLVKDKDIHYFLTDSYSY